MDSGTRMRHVYINLGKEESDKQESDKGMESSLLPFVFFC